MLGYGNFRILFLEVVGDFFDIDDNNDDNYEINNEIIEWRLILWVLSLVRV